MDAAQLLQVIGQRDFLLLVLLAIIGFIAYIADRQLGDYEAYFREHPMARSAFVLWQRQLEKRRAAVRRRNNVICEHRNFRDMCRQKHEEEDR